MPLDHDKLEEARIRRGLILLALHMNYPHPVRDASLSTQLRPAYFGADGPRAYTQDLIWLERKKYLIRAQDDVQGRVYVTYTITEDGVLIADRSVRDPGVQIGAGDGG